MPQDLHVERWLTLFPRLNAMSSEHVAFAKDCVNFPVLNNGDTAYMRGWECANYLMCLYGQTRVYRTSSTGREVSIYRVQPGGTCVLTTQCLLSGGTFPAESVAESDVVLAAIPAAAFRQLIDASSIFRDFVLNDQARLLGSLFSLIEDVAFKSVDQRLAARLLADSGEGATVHKTHHQLALDVGSVREVVTRQLGNWERAGWIATTRGSIQIIDRGALAKHHEAPE